MDHVLSVPQGTFSLERGHHDPAEPLRAWDAADELVLAHLAEIGASGDRWMVVGDAHGALATALSSHRPVSWTDSVVTMAATRANLARNGIDAEAVDLVPSTTAPRGPLDVVVVKVPRTLAVLEDELRRLRPHLHAASVVVGAGMTKDVHRSTIAAFEDAVGPTPTSLARKKARLLLATFDPSLEALPAPGPLRWSTPEGVAVTGLPGVFSASSLDAGSRLLLAHLSDVDAESVVVDLGSGTGVVAATVGHRHPGVALVCCDESFRAVAATRQTLRAVSSAAEVLATDVLEGVADASADVVLCNPPFHAGGARTSSVAHRMFAQSARVLRPGGSLTVVGNRHLGHHVTLRRWFHDVTVVGSDPRFVVLRGRRR